MKRTQTFVSNFHWCKNFWNNLCISGSNFTERVRMRWPYEITGKTFSAEEKCPCSTASIPVQIPVRTTINFRFCSHTQSRYWRLWVCVHMHIIDCGHFLGAQFIHGLRDNSIRKKIIQSELTAFNEIVDKLLHWRHQKWIQRNIPKHFLLCQLIYNHLRKSGGGKNQEAHQVNSIDKPRDFGTFHIQNHTSRDVERFQATARIDGKTVEFIVDSGSGYTFLPRDQFKNLNLKVRVINGISFIHTRHVHSRWKNSSKCGV